MYKASNMIFLTAWLSLLSYASVSSSESVCVNTYCWDFWTMMKAMSSSDSITLVFSSVVLTVAVSVLLFSEFYMEKYNNKKFFSITLSFLTAMILLSISSSWLAMAIGWEGLGATSVCLVMFYPNKTAMFNSLLTMNYNRAGDAILMALVCLCMAFYFECWFMPSSECSNEILLGVLLCAMTKSAQYPLSTWLPAAMSAPTPISAMVHSSTLVAAGILILSKMLYPMVNSEMMDLFCMVNAATFVVGGCMAIYESDLKKTVAFSTMSQISLILFIIGTGKFEQGMLHLASHAYFKSMLFMYLGVFFLMNMGTQSSKTMKTNYSTYWTSLGLWAAIFSMMGLVFSSSFYSKDLALEDSMSNSNADMLLLLITGSVLTMLYSVKIMNQAKMMPSSEKPMLMKKSNSTYMIGAAMFLTLIAPKAYSSVIGSEWVYNNKMSYTILVFILTAPCALNLYFNSPTAMKAALSTSHMKFPLYTLLGTLHSIKLVSVLSFSDMMFFKNYYTMNTNLLRVTMSISGFYLSFFTAALMAVMLFYSNSSSNMALKMLI